MKKTINKIWAFSSKSVERIHFYDINCLHIDIQCNPHEKSQQIVLWRLRVWT